MKVLIKVIAHFFALNARIDENTPARVSASIMSITVLSCTSTFFVLLNVLGLKSIAS